MLFDVYYGLNKFRLFCSDSVTDDIGGRILFNSPDYLADEERNRNSYLDYFVLSRLWNLLWNAAPSYLKH